MAKVYKIHPAVGIMRVGDSSKFFVGPERLGSVGIEIRPDGTETPISQYKDAGRVKRQAARFRVWEYDLGTDGRLTLVREVPGAMVEWTVTLVNSKAAGNQIAPVQDGNRRVLLPVGGPRNADITDRNSITINGGTRQMTGVAQPPEDFDSGEFLGRKVVLGRILTDSVGRLLVLGGIGRSEGVPTAAGGPIPPLKTFDNNSRWFDDVSDGPVTARVRIGGQAVEALPAWVICAPPDYAPAVGAPVSLYEIAVQAAVSRNWIPEPRVPSFTNDILPILRRALSLQWVHDWSYWSAITNNWAALSDPSKHAERQRAFQQITQTSLHEYGLPIYVARMLTSWRDGMFANDYGQPTRPLAEPEECDRAALEACIATSFYPGIEAGFSISNPSIYMEPFRISHQQVAAGQLTSQMAVPWQADFNDCSDDWWPSQRPNDVFARSADIPNSPVPWDDGVSSGDTAASRTQMVEKFWKLGFIVSDGAGNLIEGERDSSLPPR